MLDGVAVRLKTPTVDRDVTHLVEGKLGFTTQAPGGEVQCTFRLNAGYDAFPDLGPMSRAWVSDDHGNPLWGAGYADNPGKAYDGAQGFDLTFRGGVSRGEDVSRLQVFIDTSQEHLEEWDGAGSASRVSSASAGVSPLPGQTGVDAAVIQFNQGTTVGPGQFAGLKYTALEGAAQTLGAYSFGSRAGLTSGDYVLRIAGVGNNNDRNANTGAATQSMTNTSFGFAPTSLFLIWSRTGPATNVGSENAWGGFYNPLVKGLLLNRMGAVVNGNTNRYVLASDVVADLVGRGLLAVDAAAAEIAASTFQIDQLVYTDGATAARVLDDLAEFEPDMMWWIGGSTSDTGHQFRFVPWPTKPRYELWSDDGIEFPGTESDLCDRVTVFYIDAKGRKQSTTVVTTDPVVLARLDGRQRSAPSATLPDGLGSAANAVKAAQAILANSNAVAQAGNVTIARRVKDLVTGNMLAPAALRSGEVARVADLGMTLRVTETDVSIDAAGQSNALTLGTPARAFVDLLSGQKVHRWALPT
ncbi:hypothetical protein [Mumia sp. DW29H23]|uniref:hypothetical protein n=1 Tax=Mumia sp. DW29H23 TaxID=3421241 RepID=UPI003D694FA9